MVESAWQDDATACQQVSRDFLFSLLLIFYSYFRLTDFHKLTETENDFSWAPHCSTLCHIVLKSAKKECLCIVLFTESVVYNFAILYN